MSKGVLEIIAEGRIGVAEMESRPALRASFARVERTVRSAKSGPEDRERVQAIVELCFEYERETDPDEKANILRTLEEISANVPLELPSATLDEWEKSIAAVDTAYAEVVAREDARLQAFRKKYFALRARAGLETQAAVAKKSGLSRSYVAVIETGSHFPQQKTLQKLARAFAVEVSDLLP
jgi:DNA-binding XRE family transcriptional regulator